MSVPGTEQHGLAELPMLEKLDRLLACGVGELVAIPQIVVVGDQSSGKSSVLEGLIRKPLPRDSGLCTRFATQIVFRRASQGQIVVSIIPDQDASPEYSTSVKQWGKTISSLDADTFKKIMQEAHEQMGLSGNNGEGKSQRTFSKDVLRLEISGPDQEHLSVIDVPGTFKSTTEGLTTKADIQLVRNMVKAYMDNPRSVMLAVVPANTDLATQEILELATETDPHGDRTLGVLTKPDLVDKGAEFRVVELVEGHTRPMKLGWHIIRNPGQQELHDMALERGDVEAEFFRSVSPWSSIDKGKVGIDTLRLQLREVLSWLVKRELPKVQAEITNRLTAHRELLNRLGPERNSSTEQMAYLVELATKYQRVTYLAINATHGADDAFEKSNGLCIAPAVMSRMKTFSDDMAKYGETHSFNDVDGHISVPFDDVNGIPPITFNVRKEDDVDDLEGVLQPQKSLSYPQKGKIKDWLVEVFRNNRGFELGTFNAAILAIVMKKQSSKWADISLGFVSDVIVMVHRFIASALDFICTDGKVRDRLAAELYDELVSRYRAAITCTSMLLQVENSDIPMTLNHYFNDNLQKSRSEKASASIKKNAFHNGSHGMVVKLDHATHPTHSTSNEQHVVQEIHDILRSYYKVSRKNFVDNVCKQATIYCLIGCETNPLALFSPIFVSKLSANTLEEIAGEAPASKRMRVQLTKEIGSLTKAMRILSRA